MTGPGRPPVGPVVKVRIPDSYLAEINQLVGKRGTNRAEVIRYLLDVALG